MKRLPLAGRRIVVTRPKGQAAGLSTLIREAGGEALEVPALQIGDLPDLALFDAVAERLESFDYAIFASKNAVRRAFALLEARRSGRSWPANLQVATVGGGSREELLARGFSSVIAPGGQSDSEALLALPEFADPARVAGKRIVIFRGEGGRRLLGETLEARGAVIEHAPCYRRTLPAAGGALLAAALDGGKVDAVLVSSAEGLANLLEMLGGDASRRIAGAAFFVPHPRVADEVSRRGIGRSVVAGPGDAQMAAALVAYFSGAGYN